MMCSEISGVTTPNNRIRISLCSDFLSLYSSPTHLSLHRCAKSLLKIHQNEHSLIKHETGDSSTVFSLHRQHSMVVLCK